MTRQELDFLEWKHNVLNASYQAPFRTVTYTATTIKLTKKRYPSSKGYGRGK